MLKMHAVVFWRAFKETGIEYSQNASLNGFPLLFYIRKNKYQRLLWYIFLMAAIICAFYVSLGRLLEFLQSPTVTMLESNEYGVVKVPFSAVAVCSVNKLSRRAVNAYVEEIRNQFHSPLSHKHWLQKMKLFAGLFDSGSVDFEEAAAFQKEFLDKEKYNVKEILRKLAPKCEDLLLKCRWAGKIYDCSRLFSKRFTADGYCCTFNYARPYNVENDEIKFPGDIGIANGLTLLLNTSKDDYFLTDRSFAGFTFQVFNFADFPDGSVGGSLQEYFIPQGSDADLRVTAVTQTAQQLSMFSLDQRRCFLMGEAAGSHDDSYSRDECMMRCKARGVLRLCGCIPYYTPLDFFKANSSSIQYCTLAHLECLQRNRVTLNTFSLRVIAGYQPVSTQSLDCLKCLAMCNYNYYALRKYINPFRDSYLIPPNQFFLKTITNGSHSNYSYDMLENLITSTKDLSIVKIFFDSLFATQYLKRPLYNWYEMLSNIGGIIGIFIGCSLISAFEVVYFFGFKFIEKIYKQYKIIYTK